MPLPIAAAMLLLAGPLPTHTDIPEGHSVVVCPDEASALRMLRDFHRVGEEGFNWTVDIPHFFDGLEATGCSQNDPRPAGEIEITEVLERLPLTFGNGPETILAFRGRFADGTAFSGIVNETDNDAFPRTDLENWLWERGLSDGIVVRSGEDDYVTGYSCPDIAAARSVVAAIPDPDTASEAEASAAFDAGISVESCHPAAPGRYRVSAVHAEQAIDCGEECLYLWTALEAIDEGDRPVALVYDSSIM